MLTYICVCRYSIFGNMAKTCFLDYHLFSFVINVSLNCFIIALTLIVIIIIILITIIIIIITTLKVINGLFFLWLCILTILENTPSQANKFIIDNRRMILVLGRFYGFPHFIYIITTIIAGQMKTNGQTFKKMCRKVNKMKQPAVGFT